MYMTAFGYNPYRTQRLSQPGFGTAKKADGLTREQRELFAKVIPSAKMAQRRQQLAQVLGLSKHASWSMICDFQDDDEIALLFQSSKGKQAQVLEAEIGTLKARQALRREARSFSLPDSVTEEELAIARTLPAGKFNH